MTSETGEQWVARLRKTSCVWKDVPPSRYVVYDWPKPQRVWEETCEIHTELSESDRPCEVYRCKICGLCTSHKWTPECPNKASSMEHAVWEALNE